MSVVGDDVHVHVRRVLAEVVHLVVGESEAEVAVLDAVEEVHRHVGVGSVRVGEVGDVGQAVGNIRVGGIGRCTGDILDDVHALVQAVGTDDRAKRAVVEVSARCVARIFAWEPRDDGEAEGSAGRDAGNPDGNLRVLLDADARHVAEAVVVLAGGVPLVADGLRRLEALGGVYAIGGAVAAVVNGLCQGLDEGVADAVDGGLRHAALERGPEVVLEQTLGNRAGIGVALTDDELGTVGMAVVAGGDDGADVACRHSAEID